MPQELQKPPSPDRSRTRSVRVWVVVVVEAVVVLALAAGVGWFVNTHEEDAAWVSMLSDPSLWLLVVVVSLVGAIGNLALYYLGQGGSEAILERFPQLEGERWERINAYYRRYGAKILFLTAIPGLGTLLTLGAGAHGVRRAPFIVWVTLGKVTRNWLIVLLLYAGYQRLSGA